MSAVSLSCCVCFDEFNLTDRLPVVLPCGHTYVCEPCSKRLRSCMECRSPLFAATPKPSFPPAALRHQKPRYSPSSSPRSIDGALNTPPTSNVSSPRQELVQLPIPKNLVLISLLEAAQHTEIRQDKDGENSDDDEDSQLVAGMNLLSSDFGTYVVREKNGLVVQPLSPSPSCDDENSEDEKVPEAVENPVVLTTFVKPREVSEQEGEFVSFDVQDPVGVSVLTSNPSSLEAPSFDENRSDVRPIFREDDSTERQGDRPFMLRYGQTVQVVSFTNGIAILARRNGYIAASAKQLVKVGDASDNACKIEGMLSAVEAKKKALRFKLEELDFVEGELRDKLCDALLQSDPDPFAMAPGFERALASLSSSTPDSLSLNKSSGTAGTSERSIRNHPDLTSGRTESAEFDNFVLSVTGAPREEERAPRPFPARQVLSPEPSQPLPYFGCTGSILPGLLSDDDGANTSPLYDVRRPRSNSVRFHGIDFRTGMSGHMALTSASAHVEHGVQRRHVRQMGEHRGIANIRRVRPSGSSGSLSNPTW